MKLKLSISTCPNDTFMFDAMLHRRIDTEGLDFDLTMADIEQLNAAALAGEPDITKLSYASFPLVADRYRILGSGSALGRGNGPLLVRRVYLFSDIADAVLSDECDAGVLIHEGRFTYRGKGLRLVADLGEEWEKRTSLPLPLGAIVVSRRLDEQLARTVERVLRRSVEYAFAHPEASAGFVRSHAQELSEEVTKSHIELFVNRHSADLGEEGRRAVVRLLELENEEAFL